METKSTNPSEDLQAIREIMERSSKFLSLSGLSGIFAGVCALFGAIIAWFFILDPVLGTYDGSIPGMDGPAFSWTGFFIVVDALLVLGLALAGAVFFSYRKAREAGQKLWTNTTRRLLLHLMIPLITGGIFSVILIFQDRTELVPSVMLIFYGLSLVNAGKFTFSEIHYLGLIEIVLGIIAAVFTDYALFLWTTGFGLMHIVYGSVMYYRYERM